MMLCDWKQLLIPVELLFKQLMDAHEDFVPLCLTPFVQLKKKNKNNFCQSFHEATTNMKTLFLETGGHKDDIFTLRKYQIFCIWFAFQEKPSYPNSSLTLRLCSPPAPLTLVFPVSFNNS